MVTNLNYYSLTQTVELVKLKLTICIKTFERIKINFIIVIIQKTLVILKRQTKKVTGTFKDEAAGKPIIEFITLRSKMYSYIKDDQKVEKTAKGIKKM